MLLPRHMLHRRVPSLNFRLTSPFCYRNTLELLCASESSLLSTEKLLRLRQFPLVATANASEAKLALATLIEARRSLTSRWVCRFVFEKILAPLRFANQSNESCSVLQFNERVYPAPVSPGFSYLFNGIRCIFHKRFVVGDSIGSYLS